MALRADSGIHKRCYISAVTSTEPPSAAPSADPTTDSYWRPLREVQEMMEEGISALYAERGVGGLRPRFAYPLIRLAHTGPLTIKELAASLGLTHSALSQTVSALRTQGLVESTPGPDARTRVVGLTARGRELVPFLEDEWRATEAAAAEIDAALPVSLAEFTAALRGHLEEKPFLERIRTHLPTEASEAPRDGHDVAQPTAYEHPENRS